MFVRNPKYAFKNIFRLKYKTLYITPLSLYARQKQKYEKFLFWANHAKPPFYVEYRIIFLCLETFYIKNKVYNTNRYCYETILNMYSSIIAVKIIFLNLNLRNVLFYKQFGSKPLFSYWDLTDLWIIFVFDQHPFFERCELMRVDILDLS